MRKAWILSISLLVVLVLLIGMGAVACGGGNGGEVASPGDEEEVTPPDGEEEEGVALPPAEFEVVYLGVEPSEITAGETVTISAVVVNTGGDSGTYAATLTVGGITEEVKEVQIMVGGSVTVTFSLVKDTPGTYEVGVGELSSSLTVKEKPTPPKPGEWTITRWTGSQEVRWLTFTVNPDGTGIPGLNYRLWGLDVTTQSGTYPEGGTPIIDGQFTVEGDIWLSLTSCHTLTIFIQGEFDETGSYASGTWEGSCGETFNASGSWEATATG